MKKKEIKTIQQYFETLDIYLENLFESQRIKLLFGAGFVMYKMLNKTIYRIQNLFISLKKILEIVPKKDLLIYLKEKDISLEKKIWETTIKDAFDTKKYIRKHIDKILWYHSGSLIDLLEDDDILNFQRIESTLFEILRENIYKYESIIDKITKNKYGKLVYSEKIYKEKAITKRLKKNKWKKKNCIT